MLVYQRVYWTNKQWYWPNSDPNRTTVVDTRRVTIVSCCRIGLLPKHAPVSHFFTHGVYPNRFLVWSSNSFLKKWVLLVRHWRSSHDSSHDFSDRIFPAFSILWGILAKSLVCRCSSGISYSTWSSQGWSTADFYVLSMAFPWPS